MDALYSTVHPPVPLLTLVVAAGCFVILVAATILMCWVIEVVVNWIETWPWAVRFRDFEREHDRQESRRRNP
jgi:uncharacterized membrane-anchored protein